MTRTVSLIDEDLADRDGCRLRNATCMVPADRISLTSSQSMVCMSNSSLSNSRLSSYIEMSSPLSHSSEVICTQSKFSGMGGGGLQALFLGGGWHRRDDEQDDHGKTSIRESGSLVEVDVFLPNSSSYQAVFSTPESGLPS